MAAVRVSVPAPALVMPKEPPAMLPPRVRVLAEVVITGVAVSVTAPVPWVSVSIRRR